MFAVRVPITRKDRPVTEQFCEYHMDGKPVDVERTVKVQPSPFTCETWGDDCRSVNSCFSRGTRSSGATLVDVVIIAAVTTATSASDVFVR